MLKVKAKESKMQKIMTISTFPKALIETKKVISFGCSYHIFPN